MSRTQIAAEDSLEQHENQAGESERSEGGHTHARIERPKTLLGRLLSVGAFPVALVSVFFGFFFALERGYNLAVSITVLAFLNLVFVMFLEKILPHTYHWKIRWQALKTDILHVVFSDRINYLVFELLLGGVLLAISLKVSELVDYALWPSHWPILLQLPLTCLVAEFFHYWWHRASHEFEWIWKFHATHHSSEHMYFLAAARFHPFDNLMAHAVQMIPLVALGVPKETLALYMLFVSVQGPFGHGNVSIRLGPLNYLFAVAEVHRWHHSQNLEDANSNYGGGIIFWDLVFGTFNLPKDREHQPDDLGLVDMPRFPQNYLGQLAAPFRWGRLTEKDAEGGKYQGRRS